MRRYSRRTVLRHGSAVGAMGISAGCLSELSPFSSGGATYTDWLYAPEKVGSGHRYPIAMFKPKVLKKHEQHLSDSLRKLRSKASEFLSPAQFDSIGSALKVDGSYVVQGSFTKSDIVSTLTGYGYAEQETYNGYTMLAYSGTRTIAINDSTLLYAHKDHPIPNQKVLRSIIDAKNGEVKRYADQSKAFGTLSDHLSGDIVWSGIGRSQMSSSQFSPLAQIDGRSITINGEKSTFTYVYVLGDDGKNASDVKGIVRSNASSGVSFSQETNVLIAETTKATNKIDVSHVFRNM